MTPEQVNQFSADFENFLNNHPMFPQIWDVTIMLKPQSMPDVQAIKKNCDSELISESEHEMHISVEACDNVRISIFTPEAKSVMSNADLKEERGISQLEDKRQSDYPQ